MGKSRHKSIIKQAIEHLDSLCAIGESRYLAKLAARAAAVARGEKDWSPAIGKYTSHGTRNTYQPHILRFVNWTRDTEGIINLADLWPRADELASRYLELRLQSAKSPWTLSTERSALRFFCRDRHLAERVELPERKREKIKKSRHPVAKDKKFQPIHWQPLLKFEKAVGLRKNELRCILVKEIHQVNGELFADVSRGKGGKKREVPVLPGREQDVYAAIAGRNPEERVSKALGHNRRDVVLNNYLR